MIQKFFWPALSPGRMYPKANYEDNPSKSGDHWPYQLASAGGHEDASRYPAATQLVYVKNMLNSEEWGKIPPLGQE
eukprot:CAMPEP_0172519576 /NCGR_PEP_ID=MMETSP1066-20121228/291503_1 /TAXON_ID=671091 /ORGANISM="Coscinodiscus wailesii, Strain CCMP2513" /LENGTH=75 /DNA_ID=CAMNT_0013302195 /DNA_START=829 /DNA_END=1056 /DNA_ORIENTATION=+